MGPLILLVNNIIQVSLVKFQIDARIIPTLLLNDNSRSLKNLPFQILEGRNQKVGYRKDIDRLGSLSFQEKEG